MADAADPADGASGETTGAVDGAASAAIGWTGGTTTAAVEADGYKRTTVLGRGANGIWRVKGFRGDTEVVLTVDGAGTVTME